ncbi:MAG TPA: hypothetical protein VMT46_13810 [Anaerolineaceae bacterium]|nr:hypothetical protein [Anaerolineaceae bacterium]
MRETKLWILSLSCTVLIVVLLGIHFAVMHFTPVFYGQSVEKARSFTELMARGRDALQMVVYILLLAAALYHGLYGLRNILLELPGSQGAARAINGGLLLIGIVFFVYGSYVTLWTFTH